MDVRRRTFELKDDSLFPHRFLLSAAHCFCVTTEDLSCKLSQDGYYLVPDYPIDIVAMIGIVSELKMSYIDPKEVDKRRLRTVDIVLVHKDFALNKPFDIAILRYYFFL